MYQTTGDAVKTLITSVWIIFSFYFAAVRGQEGNGCGHTLLGAESGTLASQNYPGTYPSNIFCKWRLRVPEGRTLRLLFGDFDIENSPGCSNGSLVITDKIGYPSLGPVCGKLDSSQRNVTLSSNEVVITFMSGTHRSGRGFLLSYATDLHPELISCLQRGSHFSSLYLSGSLYCPAGCKNVTGDVWGSSEQGYRDTSVLCKGAVHAGVISDSVGGRVTVTRERSLTLYESTFANGVLSKMGSLSEKKFIFNRDCKSILQISGSNASSVDTNSPELRKFWSLAGRGFRHEFISWKSEYKDPSPWVELELSDRSMITDLVTTVSNEDYVHFYSILFSKDKKIWKLYKDPLTKEKKVFQAYTDGHLRVLNSLAPSVVARFVRILPTSWKGQATLQVQVMGCPVSKVTPKTRSNAESTSSVKVNIATLPPSNNHNSTEGPILVETRLSSSQPVIVAVGVVLGLIMCGSCLLAGVWWKQRKKASLMKYSLPPMECQTLQIKALQCPTSEFISYPLERSVHDALPNPPLNDYAEPVGQKVGSTFRPSSDEGYTTPFALNLYDTPSQMPEYAEPLPPEPEYATPFGDQLQESNTYSAPVPALASGTTSPHPAHYDCPSHKMLSNGYCNPVIHKSDPGLVNEIYAEPKSCNSLLQKHTYEQPL
ncbi:discoidin, CUB and LCCL domain-containing protein 1 [Periophthalmus magnuspinnatus]|uniref:discoidin, CUB and LCCL domain-containing protein 1 n=1 Tax=Periophthalmus magnuspinnatus TaxID=409849 RepID=UPI00145B1833|nr:discoidin, CUB and LCCL domain-containing protein 1 [Periophthalmus magnuspinnatus]